ncbi:MAG: hypothetical protein D6744_14280 [Planctomycetota bacterium]|nr:MAG: hypothetical protein D6744_14280 [Planctomycetota bacterium]
MKKHTREQVETILKLTDSAPWLWLLEVAIPTTSTTENALRLVRNPKGITWGVFNDGTAIAWEPFPFTVSALADASDSTLRTVSVSCANVNREVQAIFELYGGLIGQRAVLRLIDGSDLSSPYPLWKITGEVVSATATEKAASIEIGQAVITSRSFPGATIVRDHCRHKYGGTNCGYDTTRSGALQSCDFSLDGDNGCIAHGDDEDAAGVTRLHPLRFGGFPGVIKQTGLGA